MSSFWFLVLMAVLFTAGLVLAVVTKGDDDSAYYAGNTLMWGALIFALFMIAKLFKGQA